VNAYVDSSVILRMALGERGRLTEWSSIQEATTSALTEVECLRTLDRLSLKGQLTVAEVAALRGAVYTLLEGFDVVDLDRAILARASQPFPTPLTTLDAIHLASALQWRPLVGPAAFATHDVALARAARSVGFSVLGAPGA
jgi:predicted nucleic acid-binding protein